jgi:hypothetical protein
VDPLMIEICLCIEDNRSVESLCLIAGEIQNQLLAVRPVEFQPAMIQDIFSLLITED